MSEKTNRKLLREWVSAHRPELAELFKFDMYLIRESLNYATGLHVLPTDDIEESCGRYLDALKLQQQFNVVPGKGQAPLGLSKSSNTLSVGLMGAVGVDTLDMLRNTGFRLKGPDPFPLRPTAADERTRIHTALTALKPSPQSQASTAGRAEMRMWERVMAALEPQPVKAPCQGVGRVAE